jgi:hypothetical protein
VQKAPFFAKFFSENILKIITSVPGLLPELWCRSIFRDVILGGGGGVGETGDGDSDADSRTGRTGAAAGFDFGAGALMTSSFAVTDGRKGDLFLSGADVSVSFGLSGNGLSDEALSALFLVSLSTVST